MRLFSLSAVILAASLLSGCGGEKVKVPSYDGDGGAMAAGDSNRMQSERDAINQAEWAEVSKTDPTRGPRSKR